MSSFKNTFIGISALAVISYTVNVARISVASQDPMLTIILNAFAAALTIILIVMLVRYIITRKPTAVRKIYSFTGIAALVVLLAMSGAYVAMGVSMYRTNEIIKNL